jgi:hypothetical protein
MENVLKFEIIKPKLFPPFIKEVTVVTDSNREMLESYCGQIFEGYTRAKFVYSTTSVDISRYGEGMFCILKPSLNTTDYITIVDVSDPTAAVAAPSSGGMNEGMGGGINFSLCRGTALNNLNVEWAMLVPLDIFGEQFIPPAGLADGKKLTGYQDANKVLQHVAYN